jgi:hypothetical protein
MPKRNQAATAGPGDQVLLASRVQEVPRGGRAYEARPDLLVLVSRIGVVSCSCTMLPREEGSLGRCLPAKQPVTRADGVNGAAGKDGRPGRIGAPGRRGLPGKRKLSEMLTMTGLCPPAPFNRP